MDCEACTDRMIELLYEEIDGAEAAAARGHIEGCESCAEAYDRVRAAQDLASLLAVEEPTAGVLDGVLRAARDRAAERAPSRDPSASMAARIAEAREEPPAEEPKGLWAAIVRWLGGFAMRPQLAMAMMLLLVVGIGLWYLPELRRYDPADTHSIVDPSPGDEVGPSATLEPAEPLELQADPRTGRIRPRDGEEAGRRAIAHRQRPGAADQSAPASAAREDRAPEAEPLDAEERQEVAAAQGAEAITTAGAEGASAAAADEPEGDDLLVAEGEAFGQMELAPGESMTASADTAADTAGTAPRQGERPSTAYAYEQSAPPLAPAAGPREAERRAAAEPSASDEPVARPGADSERLLPAGLHRLARNQRDAGRCRDAVRSYGQLMSRYPTYPQAGSARIEAADCYRRLGQLSQARRLLEQASRDRTVAARARQELARVAAAERAHAEAQESSAEAAPAEAP